MKNKNLSILYVTESMAPFVIGGMQEVAYKHLMYLESSDYKVQALHSRINHYAENYFGKINFKNVKIIHLEWPCEGKSRIHLPGRYARELDNYSKTVKELVKDLKPNVIYSEGPVVNRVLTMQNRPPVIFHPHGLEVFQPYNNLLDHIRLWKLKRLINFHCQHADIVISQGGKLSGILNNRCGVSPFKIRILPNSFDEPLHNDLKKSKRFLFVGRLENRKRLKQLLQIFSMLPHLQLDVVGCDQIEKISNNIVFHGIIRDRKKLMQMYRNAFVLIVPSISEGMPTVILEAMSQGTPVIATNVGACNELVFNKKTGWLIDFGEKDILKKTILEAADILSNEYDEISCNCVKLVVEKFSSTKVKSILYRIFDEAIEIYQCGISGKLETSSNVK